MKVRLLLVDDHDDARTTLVQRLRRDARLQLVGAASTLEEAARLLPDARPDIVLLDIHGHDGRGVEACRALRQLTDAPVVVFTSYVTPALWRAAKEAGAADYLFKHVDTDRLSKAIVRLAERLGRIGVGRRG